MLERFQQLLLDMLRQDGARPDPAQFAAFQAGDWDGLIDAAITYRLASQVHDYLMADPQRERFLPANGRARLKQAVMAQLQRNFAQYRRVRALMEACTRADLPVILFKGLWLVEQVYRDPKARRSGDIDLLLRPADMPAFTRVAREFGCALPAGVDDLRSIAAATNEYPLSYPDGATKVDVHWAVTRPGVEAPIDEQSLWDRSEMVRIGGVACRSFGVEDCLLYLCFHAAVHHKFAFVGPRALLDIALFIGQPPRAIAWDDLVARAHDLGWARAAWLTFDLVREHLGIAPPAAVMAALQPEDVPDAAVRAMMLEAVFLNQTTRAPHPHIMAMNSAPWHRKPAALYAMMFPPADQLATRLLVSADQRSFWIQYLRRFTRWSVYLPMLRDMLFGDAAKRRNELRTRTIARWMDD